MKPFKIDAGNKFEIPKNLDVTGFVHGKNNKIEIGNVELKSSLTLRIYGNNNHVKIDSIFCTKAIDVRIGVSESLLSTIVRFNLVKIFGVSPTYNYYYITTKIN